MTRWNVVVTEQTDQALRDFLSDGGEIKKGALSSFIEEAVKQHLEQQVRKCSPYQDYAYQDYAYQDHATTNSYQSAELLDSALAEKYLAALEKKCL